MCPLHFAEIDAEIDALHRTQPTTTTMFHRQSGVNLVWWCGSRGGSATPRDYNALISALRFLPRSLRVLASTRLSGVGERDFNVVTTDAHCIVHTQRP